LNVGLHYAKLGINPYFYFIDAEFIKTVMLNYIKNILPRLQRFSKQLDVTEIFVGKPWILIDEHSNTHEYEFDRNGRLIMAINGNVTEGRWEFRTATNRLLIDRLTDKILLQHAFVSEGVLVLKKSGTEDIPFLLYDRNIIKDGNVQSYLENFLIKTENRRLKANDVIGRVHEGLVDVIYKTNIGDVTISQKVHNTISVHDPVQIRKEKARSGEYKLTEIQTTIIVVMGKVAYIKSSN
jgi:hypothetical protein